MDRGEDSFKLLIIKMNTNEVNAIPNSRDKLLPDRHENFNL